MRIRYCFNLGESQVPGGAKGAGPARIEHEVVLDATTLQVVDADDASDPPPDWAELAHEQCSHCPLDANKVRFCPAAKQIARVAAPFKDRFSHDPSHTEVITQERTFSREGRLQEALQGLFGLVMATSGCPHLAFLRPMARFHVPFAVYEETAVRAISFYLLRQYVRQRHGEEVTFDMKGLLAHYRTLDTVNRAMVLRLRGQGGRDGGRNAVVLLDAFAKMIQFEFADDLPTLTAIFPKESLLDAAVPPKATLPKRP